MNILLHGAGFVNKGAQLMLASVCRRLQDAELDARLFVSPVPGDHQKRARLGLGAVYPPVEHYSVGAKFAVRRWLLSEGSRVFPRILRGRHADASMNSMGAFLDISGYAFADRFGHLNLVRTARLARSFAGRGKPVVFLPQMWGPFNDPVVARAMTELAGSVDLLYARDKSSAECLATLGLSGERIRLAPDITIPVSVSGIDVQTPDVPYCCLVPNARMLDQGKWGDRHAALLTRAAGIAHQRGITPVLVVHEDAGADHDLARLIAGSLGDGVTVYADDDPLKLKAFIAKSLCLIGSRYHSIVAALSQGVPALAMGWAHKYPELLADFNCGAMAFDETRSDTEILQSATSLFDQESNESLRGRIAEAKQDLVAQGETMWSEVISHLKQQLSR